MKKKIREIREIKPNIKITELSEDSDEEISDLEEDDFSGFVSEEPFFEHIGHNIKFTAPVLNESEAIHEIPSLEETAQSAPTPANPPYPSQSQTSEIPYSDVSVYEEDRNKYENETRTPMDFSLQERERTTDNSMSTRRFTPAEFSSSPRASRGEQIIDPAIHRQQFGQPLQERRESFENQQRKYELEKRERERKRAR